MAKTTTKAKKATPTPTPPATTPDKRTLEPHELVLSPTIQSAIGIQAWGKFAGEVDLGELLKDLRERVEKVQGGDMRPVEAMLYGQAVTLETIFTSLARRATSQEYLKQFQAYLGLALKAQAQCRATLEALAEIKNPRPVAFVKQANISGGHQQVNNGVQPAQQAGSVQGGGGVESLPAPQAMTARYPTQGFFPPGAEIQTAGSAAQAA
jgi:hypothetical protein